MSTKRVFLEEDFMQNHKRMKLLPRKKKIFEHPMDQSQYEELNEILNECELTINTQCDSNVVQLISQYSVGKLIICDCKKNEILLLPSKVTQYQQRHCADCETGMCSTVQCLDCVKKFNQFCLNPPSDIRYPVNPMPSCWHCRDLIPKCMDCSFVCKGCLTYLCKRIHLAETCVTCNAEFCGKGEMNKFICGKCMKETCTWCQIKLCEYGGVEQWVSCHELYDICGRCFNPTIAAYYPSSGCYTRCCEILDTLNNTLDFKNNLLIYIAIYCNDCEGEDCVVCSKWFD